MKIKVIATLTLFLVLIGCKESKPSEPIEEPHTLTQYELDSVSKLEARKMSIENAAIIGWDAADPYTYKLQETITDSVISFTGGIVDITRDEDPFKKYGGKEITKWYTLKVTGRYKSSYIAKLSIDSIQLKKIEEDKPLKKIYQKGCFVFKVNKITSMYPQLKSEIEYYSEGLEEGNSYLTYDLSNKVVEFKGRLIDFYLYKKLPND